MFTISFQIYTDGVCMTLEKMRLNQLHTTLIENQSANNIFKGIYIQQNISSQQKKKIDLHGKTALLH